MAKPVVVALVCSTLVFIHFAKFIEFGPVLVVVELPTVGSYSESLIQS